MKLVWDIEPNDTNGRNSEGSFIRLDNGDILFAYSRYNTGNPHDNAKCDIAAIRSRDEGETWSEPVIIARAVDFGVDNIMSVSALRQQDGKIGVYYLIKENDGTSSIGRSVSEDGVTFSAQRCEIKGPSEYYVINNDRFIRLDDGRIAVSAAYHPHNGSDYIEGFGVCLMMISEDDGKTFYTTPPRLTIPKISDYGVGMQEPGIIQHRDGMIRLWARTREGAQFECYSRDYGRSFTWPSQSVFTAPDSPMEMAYGEDALYVIYNPIPKNDYNYIGRIPLVVRKSLDDGRTWGPLNVIEEDESRAYCYAAMFFTNDGAMLCGYCRGGVEMCLKELGIMKIPLEEIK